MTDQTGAAASQETITRNFLDTPSFWRQYPDRDIEFVRWYPCNIGPLTPEQMFATVETRPRTVSFYLHIPFCNQVCTSCPYNKLHTRNTLVTDYIEALKAEILLYSRLGYLDGVTFSSGYLGGGTPTTLRAEQLDDLLGFLRRHLTFTDDYTVTIESTPVDIDQRKIDALLANGVNRVSMGVQTFHDPLLRYLGRARAHTGESALRTIELLDRNGMENICIDFMIGIPGQTPELWAADIETLTSIPVTSFSVYNYAVLPGSEAFFAVQSGITPPCPSTKEADAMYHYMHEELLSRNYLALTYNDFAEPMRPEWEAKGARTFPILPDGSKPYRGLRAETLSLTDHLAQVWGRCGDMVAFGSGAYGYLNNHLYCTEPDIGRYIETVRAGRIPAVMGAYTDEHERRCRSLVLGLKLLRVSRSEYRARHGVDPYAYFTEKIDDLVAKGLLTVTEDTLQVTYPKGWHYIDNISKTFYSEANHRLPQPSSASTEILNWQVRPENGRRSLNIVQ
ncbi:coproporphyrinogen-III oxidase family protein [Streptomyces bohaiensis]|uniref:Heme chaperone HemW n=1 Tax=Streptomyces bohaiensis TaxID=1431344 RepID=A0ABX1C9X5_9ACTN|nr:coproporphyrinogen-III oxidase family protein [Streptomyces bohaiensis]NJQ15953.1 coproporphyrinogen III oxidase family protein [Streptomyces bohaiensis]